MTIKKTPLPEVTPVQVEDSVPIQVETQSPLAVTVERDKLSGLTGQIASTTSATPLPDALMLAAQRRNKINMLWEFTQAFLAMVLTSASVYSATISTRDESETLKNALFVVLGFYFGRTNHARPTALDPALGEK